MNKVRTPRLAVEHLPNLCALGPRLLTMTKLFRVWLANHFQVDSIEDPDLTDRVWNKDPKQTQIVIETNSTWDPRLVEFRPSLILKRHGWKNASFGINDRMMGEDPGTGERHFANYWQGAHTFFVCAGEDGETEKLATEVYRELNQFGKVLQVYLNLFKFVVSEVGELATLEEAKDNFVVPIDVGYVIEEGWTIRNEAPFFDRLDLAILNA